MIEHLFVFILIIIGIFLSELLPCNFQKLLTNSIELKHFFGFITLLYGMKLSYIQLRCPSSTISNFYYILFWVYSIQQIY